MDHLLPSPIIFAFILGAFSPLITFSNAAGIRISQSISSASVFLAKFLAPGKFKIEPVVFAVFKYSFYIQSFIVVNRTFIFCKTNNFCSCILEKFSGVITHITQVPVQPLFFLLRQWSILFLPLHRAYCILHGGQKKHPGRLLLYGHEHHLVLQAYL